MANKYKSSINRAKIYINELASRKENFDLINSDFDRIWQIEKKYLLSPISSGLVFVNQHRAHFRILFDQFNDAFNNKPVSGQILLFPEKINIDSNKKEILLGILPYLERIGFKLKEYPDGDLVISSIPIDVVWGSEKKIINFLIDEFQDLREKSLSVEQVISILLSKKIAIKENDILNLSQMREVLNRLFSSSDPYYSPEGKKIIYFNKITDIDNRFYERNGKSN